MAGITMDLLMIFAIVTLLGFIAGMITGVALSRPRSGMG